MRLFDLHCDTLTECRKTGAALRRNALQVDLERGPRRDGWIQVFAVFVPDTLRGEEAFCYARDTLDFARQEEKNNADALHFIRQADDLDREDMGGLCRGILAIEGGAALAGDIQRIEELYRHGVKLITLTWNGSNELGHGCLSGCPDGLTPFGKEALRRMEHIGIVPDVSHLNERGFWDVAELASRPFIASHSVSAAVHPHPRNLTDFQFAAIRESGGIVGLNVCESQLGEQSFAQIERHLVHFLELEGERTVAFGCDFDGADVPEEWNGISVMERLYAYFLRRNFPAACLERLFFQNARDFFADALTKGLPIA